MTLNTFLMHHLWSILVIILVALFILLSIVRIVQIIKNRKKSRAGNTAYIHRTMQEMNAGGRHTNPMKLQDKEVKRTPQLGEIVEYENELIVEVNTLLAFKNLMQLEPFIPNKIFTADTNVYDIFAKIIEKNTALSLALDLYSSDSNKQPLVPEIQKVNQIMPPEYVILQKNKLSPHALLELSSSIQAVKKSLDPILHLASHHSKNLMPRLDVILLKLNKLEQILSQFAKKEVKIQQKSIGINHLLAIHPKKELQQKKAPHPSDNQTHFIKLKKS